MFQHILVPLDGSELAEQALPVAERIAHHARGKIVLLNGDRCGRRSMRHY